MGVNLSGGYDENGEGENGEAKLKSAKEIEQTRGHEMIHAMDDNNSISKNASREMVANIGGATSGMLSTLNNWSYGDGGLNTLNINNYVNANQNQLMLNSAIFNANYNKNPGRFDLEQVLILKEESNVINNLLDFAFNNKDKNKFVDSLSKTVSKLEPFKTEAHYGIRDDMEYLKQEYPDMKINVDPQDENKGIIVLGSKSEDFKLVKTDNIDIIGAKVVNITDTDHSLSENRLIEKQAYDKWSSYGDDIAYNPLSTELGIAESLAISSDVFLKYSSIARGDVRGLLLTYAYTGIYTFRLSYGANQTSMAREVCGSSCVVNATLSVNGYHGADLYYKKDKSDLDHANYEINGNINNIINMFGK